MPTITEIQSGAYDDKFPFGRDASSTARGLVQTLNELGVPIPQQSVTSFACMTQAAEDAVCAAFPPPKSGGKTYAEIRGPGGIAGRTGYYDEEATLAAGWSWRRTYGSDCSVVLEDEREHNRREARMARRMPW